jgi:hypothetical protein
MNSHTCLLFDTDPSPRNSPYSETKTTAIKNSSNNSISPTKAKDKSSVLSIDTEPDAKKLYNEMVRMTQTNHEEYSKLFFSVCS